MGESQKQTNHGFARMSTIGIGEKTQATAIARRTRIKTESKIALGILVLRAFDLSGQTLFAKGGRKGGAPGDKGLVYKAVHAFLPYVIAGGTYASRTYVEGCFGRSGLDLLRLRLSVGDVLEASPVDGDDV